MQPPSPSVKQRAHEKVSRIPVKIAAAAERIPKPSWIRVQASFSSRVQELKQVLRAHKLHTVCEEANCPNLSECFSKGTATFMIMGDKCTRRCAFCDVAHGRPDALDADEPKNLAKVIAEMGLAYVVVTSVDRDDLKDGGAAHFADCIREIRLLSPQIEIEVLVPDFRKRMEKALDALSHSLPDVFNHNLETIPRLYKSARAGSDYQHSLNLIAAFKKRFPAIPTKSGLMLGLGETNAEIVEVMRDLRAHDCDWLTLGQYLQPSPHHLPVDRYVTPDEFRYLAEEARNLGFLNVASGPLVRSSYHADKQAKGELVE